MKRLCWVIAGWLLISALAQAEDAFSWLQKMNQASRSLSFSGIFVYQSQGRTESSRIARLIDGAGEHERLETLEGTPREVIRFNEDVRCYLPAEKLIVLDRAILARQPGRLVSKAAALGEIYDAKLTGSGRIAGRDARIVNLTPRDEWRYGHELWIDAATGLLLKARLLTGDAGLVEQFSFMEMAPGADFDHEQLRARSSPTDAWRVINAAGESVSPEEIPWVFRKLPAGFKQVSLVRRKLHADGAAAIHAAFSDGLANVSVFIEPTSGRSSQNMPHSTGAVGIYRRLAGSYQVTAMGEVPVAALKRVAEGVEQRRK
ncbi:MucB/RseB C-terminal domain-containing protein [Uliginosibacterium paludis]|uniref:MucB/RseB C-terminal domain-containing protein n=1 Tax=Uliginosibacterium paludis TaxID=1615952 RepID=A0ABV2CLR8_9RHOO